MAKSSRTGKRRVQRKVDLLIQTCEQQGDTMTIDALRRWKRLSKEEQHQICHEIIVTRGAELHDAYESIISVESGFRTTGQGDKARQTNERVIILHVRRKWTAAPKSKAVQKKQLPSYLMAFCTDPKDGQRQPCAVPTDIINTYVDAEPEGSRDPTKLVYVFAPEDSRVKPNNASKGVITCAVRVRGSAGPVYAMGCHHVLARSVSPRRRDGTPLKDPLYCVLAVNRQNFAQTDTEDWIGRLVSPDQGASADVALAHVQSDDLTILRQALGRTHFEFSLAQGERPPLAALILTDQNGAVKVRNAEPIANCQGIKYLRGARQPFHRLLYRWQFSTSKTTQKGDSGSPVVSLDGRQLVGMHIGRGGNRAYMIPAYFLFTGYSYGQSKSLELLTTV